MLYIDYSIWISEMNDSNVVRDGEGRTATILLKGLCSIHEAGLVKTTYYKPRQPPKKKLNSPPENIVLRNDLTDERPIT